MNLVSNKKEEKNKNKNKKKNKNKNKNKKNVKIFHQFSHTIKKKNVLFT